MQMNQNKAYLTLNMLCMFMYHMTHDNEERGRVVVANDISNGKHFKLQGTKNSSLLDLGCKVQQGTQMTLRKLLKDF
jgi:hypothetical protein